MSLIVVPSPLCPPLYVFPSVSSPLSFPHCLFLVVSSLCLFPSDSPCCLFPSVSRMSLLQCLSLLCLPLCLFLSVSSPLSLSLPLCLKLHLTQCISYTRPLLFALPSGFGIWNVDFQRGREEKNANLRFFISRVALFLFSCSYFLALLCFFWLRAHERESAKKATAPTSVYKKEKMGAYGTA